MNRILVIVLRWLVVLAMPILLVLGSARIMVNTWYPRYEYAKADFPPDRYGFTQAQRLEFGTVSIDFLNAPQRPEVAIKLLEDQRLPGTENMPLFTVYELGHMVDVKRLTDMLWRVLLGAAIIVVGGLIILLARRSTRREGYAALFGGGLVTTGLLTVLTLLVLTSWQWFFITFHDVFFRPGTWQFDWTDSLIRTFPDKFWFDAGVLLVGGALVAGVVVMVVGYVLGRRAGRDT
jgi:integral membrane protein (TIGR01906 family)